MRAEVKWWGQRWNDEGRGAAHLSSGSCPVRCASPLLQVKWRSLANKSGEALLPESSHAFQPILGWDVLKQHTEYQFAGTGPETSKDLLKVVQPMARPESKSFTVFGLWCWVMQTCGPWWLLSFLTPAWFCAQCMCLWELTVSFSSLKWGYSVENKD